MPVINLKLVCFRAGYELAVSCNSFGDYDNCWLCKELQKARLYAQDGLEIEEIRFLQNRSVYLTPLTRGVALYRPKTAGSFSLSIHLSILVTKTALQNTNYTLCVFAVNCSFVLFGYVTAVTEKYHVAMLQT